MKIKSEPIIFATMKFCAFILAVVVLALSALPCMDDACLKNVNAKAQVTTTHHTNGHNENDPCSPFCTCNCCAGFTILSSQIKIERTSLLTKSSYASYLPSTIIEISLPIWQPPKIS